MLAAVMVALAEWIESEESAVADARPHLGEADPHPKNRVRRFFPDSPDRVGETPPQVVDRVGVLLVVEVRPQRAPSLARSEQQDILDALDGNGSKATAATGAIVLSAEEARLLKKNGQFRLDGGRVRSLKYFGNQYDKAAFVKLMKSGQVVLVNAGKFAGWAGNSLTVLTVAADTYAVVKGEMTAARWALRTTGGVASIVTGATVTPVVGVAVGAGTMTLDYMIYEMYGDLQGLRRRSHRPWSPRAPMPSNMGF